MSEAEFTEQMLQVMSLFLGIASIMITIVSGYVVALFFFLRRTGVIMRIWGFSFLSFVLLLLAIFSFGAYRHGVGVRLGLTELADDIDLTPLGDMALERQADWVGDASIGVFAFIGVALYLALAHLTFFHRWQVRPSDTAEAS
ncbi:MAG: hypothetical protein AAGI03_04430 [Pseudomonadota bacterium]